MTKPNLAIFSGRLLPPSETFVRAQAEGVQQFNPYYLGARFVKGLTLPRERTLVVNSGGTLGAVQEVLFKSFGFAPQFYQKVQQINPVLIHAHFGPCGALALPLARTLKLPLIVTYHGFDAMMTDEYARQDSISTRVYLKRREALKKEVKLLIAVSEFIRSTLIKKGFPDEKIKVHYIGVNTDFFQADPQIKRESVVLFVGRLAEKKGCEYLIQAMAEVQKVDPNVKLVIIGDGDLRTELEALAAKLLQRYQFLGLQPSDEVKRWMNRSQLLAVPSITASNGDSEGLPMVVVEAQAMGLPVVGSIHAGIPEAVIDGETGFLVPERDHQGLAKSILTLLQDEELWEKMSNNGKQRMRSQFNLSQQTQTLDTIYQRVTQNQLN
ncbi:MAG: glycosyltransferase [Cyanobacteriota bacterium]|nr:glycosyltransferase [Cyanobacteriota bacterium]